MEAMKLLDSPPRPFLHCCWNVIALIVDTLSLQPISCILGPFHQIKAAINTIRAVLLPRSPSFAVHSIAERKVWVCASCVMYVKRTDWSHSFISLLNSHPFPSLLALYSLTWIGRSNY